jgi:hypothetical protein
MAPSIDDPRMTSIKPRLKYNTIGGVNGPLVILDNVIESATAAAEGHTLMWDVSRSNSPDTTRSSA